MAPAFCPLAVPSDVLHGFAAGDRVCLGPPMYEHGADALGITALLVHAISKQGRRFYLAHCFSEPPV